MKKNRFILELTLSIFMFFCLFPVDVKASAPTYYELQNNVVFRAYSVHVSSSDLYADVKYNNSSAKVRVVCFLTPSELSFYLVTDTYNVKAYTMSNGSGSWYQLNWNKLNYEGTNFYYRQILGAGPSSPYESDVPTVNLDVNSSGELAVRYAFGDYASEGGTDWANPRDVNLSTTYAGNVERSQANIDKITWNRESDSVGNSYITHINEHPVIEVQAVPVTWKTSTLQEMENQTGIDATIGNGVVLDSIYARSGHLEITWQEVLDYLQIEYANIYSAIFDGEYWIQRGWYYQYRLVADDYVGEWLTLTNGLNITPKKSKKLIEDPYDETIYNLLKEISETNNQTTTVYEYGDNNFITINTDPSSGWQDPDGGGSFWDFLASVVKAISDGIASIVSSVTSLVGDLVDGILGLFTFDNFTINNYDTEVQTIKDNSGIFGQSIEFADSIKDSIRGVEQQPAVLHFDGIVIDNVQLIPAVDLDFDQMVVDAGLTDFHNLVYVFTDGAILISLIIMVHRKVMEVLRK